MLTMQLYSTNNKDLRVGFRTALLEGLPPDRGLYMPVNIPAMGPAFWEELTRLSFPELTYRLAIR